MAFKKRSKASKEAAGPILGPPVGYVDMLDASLRAKAKAEAAAASRWNPLRPSAAGYCTRKLANEYYDYTHGIRRAAEDREPEASRLLDFGSSVEYHGVRLFKQMDIAAIREEFPELADLKALDVKYTQQVVTICELAPDVRVEGSMDLCFYSEKYRCILDFKSKKVKARGPGRDDWEETDRKLANMDSVQRVSDTLFYVDNLVDFLDELEDPFFAHNFVQLNAYATTGFIQERGIDHASILQYCKNDSRIRETRFRPSEEVAEMVRNKFKFVYDAVVNHKDPTLAPMDYELGSIVCAFCPWSKDCYGEDSNAKQAFFATFRRKG
jgi:hypothetical protein